MRILTSSPPIRVLWVVALIFWLLPRASTAQCIDTREVTLNSSISVVTTGAATAPYTTLYILTDVAGVVAASNTTGSFAITTVNSQRVYTLNYDTGNIPTNAPPVVGSNISSITGGCFNADFLTEYLCVDANEPSCIDSRTVCATDPFSVSTTGNNTDPDYKTTFVLIEEGSGMVVTSNALGDFTGFLVAGTNYFIATINYSNSNPPVPLSINTGDDPYSIGTTSTGCYNTDYLNELLCISVIDCAPNCLASLTINQGDPLSVSTTGNTTAPGYTTVFVLADDATGIVAASNSTGVFTSDVQCGKSYAILTLNYDSNNAPVPLPINAGNDATTIGSTTAGCYNADFLTEFLCVSVNPCPNCLSSQTFCQGDAVIVTTSGNTTSAGYITTYVLVNDATDLVVASNTTGIFTSDVTGGNNYYVLTLNYDAGNAPSPLPINTGDDPTTIGSTTAGCYNGDFLTEKLCLTVNNCCTANAGDIDQVEMCQGATAPTDLTPLTPAYGGGFGAAPTPAANYSYAYFLTANAAPNNILQGPVVNPATFSYSGLVAGTYRIYGFSYQTSQGPLINTTIGSPILGVGMTSGVCLEATFTYLVVNPTPVPPVLSDATYCTGQTATALNVTTAGALNYSWTPGGSISPILTPSTATAGSTTYAVTVTGIGGCTATQDAIIAVNQTPTAPALADASYCLNAIATALNATTAGATYLWSNAATTASITPLTTTAGNTTYTVTVTVGGCSVTADAVVAVNSATASITPSGPTTFCSGGSVALVANGGGTYLWSNAATTQTITASTAGTYTVTVTNNGCTATASQVVTVNTTTALITPSGSTTVCSPATVGLTASGGGTYLWSNAATTQTITASTTGTYTVTVTLNGCTATASQSVTINSTTAAITPSGPTTFCSGGSVALVANGGGTYLWSNAATTQTITASTAGTYTVTVTNNGCTATASQVVTVNTTTAAITPSGATTVCSPATVDLTASGGGTYLWSNAATTQTITASTTGTYTVTVTLNGCTATASQSVTINSATASITPSGPTTFCSGGSVALVANGGGTYLWSNAATTQTITASTAGTYTVTVTNNGCTATASQVVTVNTTTALITPSGSTTVCSPATVDLTASGGGTYLWSTGSTTALITASTSGTYTVTVTLNGCTATASQSVTINSATASITPSGPTTFCSGGSVALVANGGGTYLWSNAATTQTITASTAGTYTVTVTNNGCTATASQVVTVNTTTAAITPSGATTVCSPATVGLTASGGGTYLWSNAATTQTITASTTGTYTVTVTLNGCTATASQTVTINSATASITPSGPTTFCSGGSVALVANGGGTYLWSNAATTQTITASTAGTYTVTVTNNGCTATASQVVTVSSAIASITPSGPTAFCAGGSVDLVASGGGTYLWNTGATTATITATVNGTYMVTVTNGSCVATAAQNVVVNPTPAASITPSGPTTFCSGGLVALVANGGGTYLWSNAATTQTITVLTTGTYSVTVTGIGGCTATASQGVTVNSLPIPDAGADQAICSGQSASLVATGGGTYLWSTGATTATISVTPPSSTTYTVTVTGTGGCTASDAVIVLVNTTPTATASNNGPLCDTRDILLFASGGTGYAWSGPLGFSSTLQNPPILTGSAQFPGVGSWTYTVTVSNGSCSATAATTIAINQSPTIAASSNSPVCTGGTINLNSSYGNPTANDIYQWTGPNSFASGLANPSIAGATILNGGIYTLNIANEFGCTAAATTSVVINSAPSATITANATCNGAVSTVSLSVPNAGSGSTYSWSGAGVSGTSNTQTITGLAAGPQTYTVTVTNAGGCTSTGSATVTVPSCTVCGAAAGTVVASSGCVGSPITPTVSGNNASAGFTTQFIVTTAGGIIVYIGTAPINGLAAGNYLLYSYNYQTQPTPAPVVGGSIATYTTGTNNTGCYDVSNSGAPFGVTSGGVALVGTSNPSQGNNGGVSPFYYNIQVLTVEGGTQPYDFTWDNSGYVRYDIAYGDADSDGIPDATITVYYADNATWNVTVTDSGGCGGNTPVVFTNTPGTGTDNLLDIINYVITPQSGTANNGAVNITVAGGGAGCAPYSYQWSGPDGFTATTEDISGLAYGWYVVTVTCADGSQNTIGWYWVPRTRRGRTKADGIEAIGLAAMPNPFSNETNIEFYVSVAAQTTVSVYAVDGKRVAVLFDDIAVADEMYSVPLSGGNLPAGVYTVLLTTNAGEVQTYKVVLTK